MYFETLLLVLIIIFLFYKWATANYGVLKERGIIHDKPKMLIGNTKAMVLFGKYSFLRSAVEQHLKFKGSKVYGIYNMRDPVIFINDPELIKKVGIKDFDKFPNHKMALKDLKEDILLKGLITLEDRKWKEMRNILTPSFTGSKMRLMFELINACCNEGTQHIENELKANEKNEIELEMKEYFTRFANDVIASVAFGLKVNSFENKDNEFYKIGLTLTQFKALTVIKVMIMGWMPKVTKMLGFKIMDQKNIEYFSALVFEAMKYRKQNNVVRPDMIHLLMEAKQHYEQTKSPQTGEAGDFDDDALLAQCLLFFLAGFETVSTCLCFTTYELAINQDAQECLYQEVLSVEKELNGKPLDYDTLIKMKYMDMILSESLRLWPPVIFTDRVCSQDYELKDDEGNLIAGLKKGDQILLSIIGIHRDPENYPNPEKFDPQRFAEENAANIKSALYLPFGIGPRNCIGNRLALMETKSIIYHLLLKFKLVPAEKTAKDMLNEMQGFQLIPKDKFWIKFVPREN